MKYILLLLSIITLSSACNSSKNNVNSVTLPFNDNLPKFDKQAHRGGRGAMPENTIDAMIYALGTSITTLEMDVVITKDKQVILSHEPFFHHELTTTPKGDSIDITKEKDYNIYQMNYAEVKRYDVGMKAHPRFPAQQKLKAVKPLLSDVFAAIKNYMLTAKRPPIFYNIESKTNPATDGKYHPAPGEFVDLLMKEIIAADLSEQVIIQSFDFRTLQYLHKKYPLVKTAMLIEVDDNRSFRKQLDDLGFNPTIYSPSYELVTKILVSEAHSKGIRIIPWTVNDAGTVKILKKLKVDGIITDFPKLLK
jgi:glycerophosphoryl diester phosphodiesterase